MNENIYDVTDSRGWHYTVACDTVAKAAQIISEAYGATAVAVVLLAS